MYSSKKVKRGLWFLPFLLLLSGCKDDAQVTIQEDVHTTEAEETDDTDTTEAVVEEIFVPRNIGIYMYGELSKEMGDEVLPEEFFDKEKIKQDQAFELNNLSYFSFLQFPTEEELHNTGEYPVVIAAGDKQLSTKLIIQDTTAPVINVPEEKIFERGENILYRSGVTVTDNSNEEIELNIDSSRVDANVPGVYEVVYTATDSAGNTGTVTGLITIEDSHTPTKEEVDVLADEILAEIITNNMTNTEKARAIFDWCQENIRVTGHSRKDSELYGAYDGFYYREGDCYTSYASSSWLLEKCGVEVIALKKPLGDATHYWSLINTGKGWYHFDCSHQKEDYHCFMQTDAQVKKYAEEYRENPEEFDIEDEEIPLRATEIIYVDPLFQ